MSDPTKKTSTATNPLAKPKFKGERETLIGVVDGYPGLVKHIQARRLRDGVDLVPWCFSDPNLESGVCNPNLPLKENEPHLCSLHKSCLIAKLLSCGIKCDPFKAREKPYEEVLAEADALFDQEPEDSTPEERDELLDRQTIRAQAHAVTLQPPPNAFRKNSVRKLILDILSRDWISLKDLKAVVATTGKMNVRRLDLILHNVTSIATQEEKGYRIVESNGKYKAFRR